MLLPLRLRHAFLRHVFLLLRCMCAEFIADATPFCQRCLRADVCRRFTLLAMHDAYGAMLVMPRRATLRFDAMIRCASR